MQTGGRMNATGIQAGIASLLLMNGYDKARVMVLWDGGDAVCSVHVRGAPQAMTIKLLSWLNGSVGVQTATVKIRR